MAKVDYKDMTTEQLEEKLASIKTIQRTVVIIFAVIVLVWIVGGYWLQNTPVFISTVAMGAAATAAQFASSSALKKELLKREEAPSESGE